jgi:hypothetical protein
MNIIAILSQLAPAIFSTIDKSVADKDLALNLKHELASQMTSANGEIAKAASSIVIAEAQGESWLQRNWRPLLMIWFSILIGGYWFGFVPANMPITVVEDLFTLVQIGVGGYVVGRSGEKIAKIIGPSLTSK